MTDRPHDASDRGAVLVASLAMCIKLTAGVAVWWACATAAGEAELRAEADRQVMLRSGGGSCANCLRPSVECSCVSPDHH